MKRFGLLLLILFVGCGMLLKAKNSEKKALGINDFAAWKILKNQTISNNGKLVSFEINRVKGDGNLVVRTIGLEKADTIHRGYDACFSPESDFIAYKIKQPADSIRNGKKKKLKKEQMPEDSLGIYVFNRNKIYTFPNLKQFSIPKESARWIAFLTFLKEPAKKNEKKTEKKIPSSEPREKADQPGDHKYKLVLFNVATGDTVCFKNVTEYYYAPLGQCVAFITQVKDSVDRTQVTVFNTVKQTADGVFRQIGTAKNVTSDDQGFKYGFLFSPDTTKEKGYRLYYGMAGKGEPKAVAVPGGKDMVSGWTPSPYSDLSFSKNSSYLFMGTARKPQSEPKDTFLTDEKPMLDIWSWKDKELQPQQKINLKKEKERTYKAVYLTDKDHFVQLCDTLVKDIRIIQKGNGQIALGVDSSPYQLESSWTGQSNADFYLIDIETGARRIIVKNKLRVTLSPGGKYVVWYDPADRSFCSRSTVLNSNEIHNLSSKIPVSFCDERWDMPGEPNIYGIAGWSEKDQDLFLYDRYDIWRFSPDGSKAPANATNNYGRTNYLKLRYIQLDPEEEFIDSGTPVILQAFNEHTKAEGFFRADLRKNTNPHLLLMEDSKFENLGKAKNAENLIFTGQQVNESPNLRTGNLSFQHMTQLSNVNPQQDKYVWPKVKLVHWTTFAGKPLEGLLYYPETLDPNRKYPMVVYFYERNADNLNSYTPPSPTRSIVNRTYYASNDYIVFIPDIVYEIGSPGKSAYDAIVSGTRYITREFSFIDSTKVGIQGQSWGGYQTAWLITQTNMFKAAMAGALVSNMISAYGGIRWETGISRMFQYEKEQSRIGATLWDKPLSYIENSPIFYVPKIETPLLMMQNDNDGAVPWYQGIEFFTAMRRLNKPVWMLTYNNEEHNLKAESWANRMDLTIRMMGFFDHYLKGSAMPGWMQNGIPAIRKGQDPE